MPAVGELQPSWVWARRTAPGEEQPPSCAYTPEDVALKLHYSAALLDELGGLTGRVYLMLLPDLTLGLDTPEFRERWARHLAVHAELVADRPFVHLVDLVSGGVVDPLNYRDGFHLSPEGIAVQQALFAARMADLLPKTGWPPAAGTGAGGSP